MRGAVVPSWFVFVLLLWACDPVSDPPDPSPPTIRALPDGPDGSTPTLPGSSSLPPDAGSAQGVSVPDGWKTASRGPADLEAAADAEALAAAQVLSQLQRCQQPQQPAKPPTATGILTLDSAGATCRADRIDALEVHFASGAVATYRFSTSQAARWDVTPEGLLAGTHDFQFRVTRTDGTDLNVVSTAGGRSTVKSLEGSAKVEDGLEQWELNATGNLSGGVQIGGTFDEVVDHGMQGSLTRPDGGIAFREHRVTRIMQVKAGEPMSVDQQTDFAHHFGWGDRTYDIEDGRRAIRLNDGRHVSTLLYEGTVTSGGAVVGSFRNVDENVGGETWTTVYLDVGSDSTVVEHEQIVR